MPGMGKRTVKFTARGIEALPLPSEWEKQLEAQPCDGRIYKNQGIQGCALQSWLQAEGRCLVKSFATSSIGLGATEFAI